jgi:hypothetical protein
MGYILKSGYDKDLINVHHGSRTREPLRFCLGPKAGKEVLSILSVSLTFSVLRRDTLSFIDAY